MSTQEQANPNYSKLLRRTLRLQREGAGEFYRALACARKEVTGNHPELAVDWCRYGATVAMLANPGFFYSHEMEQLLGEIARRYGAPVTGSSDTTGPPARFLHLTTTTSAMGGHTRAISRWIETCAELAPSEHHSILISRQRDEPVPAWITCSVQRSGGEVFQLPSTASWLQAATEVRAKASEFDVIVLHTEPNDPLLNLAFYDQPRPVLYFSHTDHVFSLGTDVARVIADVRTVGHDISVRYRSPTARKVLLPLPLLDDGCVPYDKLEARKKLGLPMDALIALTIGEPYKFSPMLGYSFPAVVQSICEGDPRVRIVAIGISELEPFPELKRSTGGRFVPVGVVEDRDILELYYSAADIYLDSVPCSSLTAVLDAARRGLPVQRLTNPYQRLLWCDDPGLDSVTPGVASQAEFVAGVLEWLKWSEDKRAELGGRFRAAVLREHCGASWRSRWLDPTVKALSAPCHGSIAASQPRPGGEENPFLGLAGVNWGAHWPAGMFVAGAILGTDHVPRPIRISGVLHSIKPLLLDTAGDGMARKRLLMFRWLVASIVPKQIFTALQKMLREILKRLQHQRDREG
jgi:hypothetical protein